MVRLIDVNSMKMWVGGLVVGMACLACEVPQAIIADPVEVEVDQGVQGSDLGAPGADAVVDAAVEDLSVQDAVALDFGVDLVMGDATTDTFIDAPQLDATTTITCEHCHGGMGNAAPPVAVSGLTSTTERGVGAHQAHLAASNWRAPIACTDCHLVPQQTNDVGHIDSPLPAEVVFSAIAKTDGAIPVWDNTRCSNTYCHGATLAGGNNTEPLWTKVDGTEAACGSCHSLPPTGNHPVSSQCSGCHSAVVNAAGAIINAALHIDGQVALDLNLPCNSCHGNALNAAPPKDSAGNSSTTMMSVGAHQAHVQDGAMHKAYDCSVCHLVPSDLATVGHIDSALPAEVTFGVEAKGDLRQPGAALKPTFDGQSGACANTYCHGLDLASMPAPLWTQTATLACNGCHGMPPEKTLSGATHVASSLGNCHYCHPAVVDAQGKLTDKSKHADGKVDVLSTMACNACHGNANNSAPPNDVDGNTATTNRGVGAHQAHVTKTALHDPYPCTECHIQPNSVASPGHLDPSLPAEVVFGSIASGKTRTLAAPYVPSYNATTLRCQNVYCHSLAGAGDSQPQWTQSSTGQCNGCHGMPPEKSASGMNHPTASLSNCSLCHGAVVGKNGKIISTKNHANGKVDVNMNLACNVCHGSANSAPPQDVSGNSNVGARGVGAHQIHVTQTALHGSYACSVCHISPSTVMANGHMDSALPAEIVFGAEARGNLRNPPLGYSPTWNTSQLTCGNTYCHNPSGATSTPPSWTSPQSSSCTDCHAMPPTQAGHPSSSAAGCVNCHADVVDANLKIIDPLKHVNGQVEISGSASCSSCHGGVDNAAPPNDTSGNSSTTARGVGAHQIHVEATNLHAGYACNVCHVMPQNMMDSGHMDSALPAEVVLGDAAKGNLRPQPLGLNASWDATQLTCSTVYCHSLEGGTAADPVWNNAKQSSCGDCHGLPPSVTESGVTHVASSLSQCVACHGSVVDNKGTIVDVSKHADGKVDVSTTIGCNGCHGSAQNAAPPQDLSGNTNTSSRGVGAHQAHVTDTALHTAYGCDVCHITPTKFDDPGHLGTGPAEVVFGPIAKGQLAIPQANLNAAWNTQTLSCSTTYCHSLNGGDMPEPVWTSNSYGGCDGCHGFPPNYGAKGLWHLEAVPGKCASCHLGVNSTATAITDPSLHANGTADLDPDSSCCECHYSPCNP